MAGEREYAPIPGWVGGDANAAYLDKTLRYGDLDTAFDERVSWRTLLQMWARAALVGLTVFVLIAALVLLGGGYESLGAVAGLASLVYLVVLVFSRTSEPIAEWRVLLIDREDRAHDVYNQISGTLRRRRSPLRVVPHRLRMPGQNTVNERLLLTEGAYQAYVSVFPYGSSLYLGWTMWRSRRGYQLIGHFLTDLARSFAGHNSDEEVVMRSERPRAMREAVHIACREGLFVALENRSVADAFGFPTGLPPVLDSLLPSGTTAVAAHSVPRPAPPVTPAAPPVTPAAPPVTPAAPPVTPAAPPVTPAAPPVTPAAPPVAPAAPPPTVIPPQPTQAPPGAGA
ncbi:hypothetical protein [Streptomyces sp. 8K308]|uniref:hypothetical protein n=1 Tax=Streptomyces sp. 8K308 TaxID=2530388 RepID=UPI001A9FF9CD|nr:hypothetical protein [Streptomyces sp. 8K308]